MVIIRYTNCHAISRSLSPLGDYSLSPALDKVGSAYCPAALFTVLLFPSKADGIYQPWRIHTLFSYEQSSLMGQNRLQSPSVVSKFDPS